MGGFILSLNNWSLLATQAVKDEAPLVFAGAFQFSTSQTVCVFDPSADLRFQAAKFSVRSLWIDNSGQSPGSAAPVPITVTLQSGGQILQVKANTQGYYPVVAQDKESGAHVKLSVSAPTATSLVIVPIWLLNFYVESFVWGQGAASAQTPWTSNIDAGGFNLTDCGGITVNTGGSITTPQVYNGGELQLQSSTDVLIGGPGPTSINASAINLNSSVIKTSTLPSVNPGVGTKQLWYDPADANSVKFAP